MKNIIRIINLIKPPSTALPGRVVHEPEAPTPAPAPAYERIICSQLLNGVFTLEVVRDALLRSSEDLRSEQQAFDELNSRHQNAKSALEDLVKRISQVDLSVGQSTDSLAQFQLTFEEINKYVNEINQLSRHTNLIAINSAIEAAHVGNKGAGFSVIAKEIKNLSAGVHRSADNIASLTKNIEKSAGHVCSVVSAVRPTIAQINEDISDVVASINTVIERSARMQSIISFISTLQFLNTVKLDHVIWKLQVYKLLLEEREDHSVNAHTDCRLGKWYYKGEGRKFAQYGAYRRLEQPHAEVHSAGRQALEAFFNKNIPGMEAALVRMEEASNSVVQRVEELAAEIKC